MICTRLTYCPSTIGRVENSESKDRRAEVLHCAGPSTRTMIATYLKLEAVALLRCGICALLSFKTTMMGLLQGAKFQDVECAITFAQAPGVENSFSDPT